MKTLKLTFKNKSGHELAANLELPGYGKPKAYAIFAHCFTCSKNLNAVINISRALTMRKIAVLRFDFTGLGESTGEFAETNFSSNIEDLVSAAEFLKTNYESPQLLIGHSLGGAAVLAAAHHLPNIKAIATLGAPFDPKHVKHMFTEHLDEIEKNGEASVSIGGRPFKVKAQLLDDLNKSNSEKSIHKLKKAVLIMHSPQDEIVEIQNARHIYEAARHPKSFVTLDGANHLMTRKEDSVYAGEIISSWVNRYIDFTEPEQELKTEKQVITRTGRDGYVTDILAGNHYFIADEPETVGGFDLGPSPYDFLVAALGSCTSMTLRMYADRKKWPLDEVKVHLEHNKVHKEDCDSCDQSGSKIDRIERTIELEGDLSKDQRARLLEIADKCPVHKTLHNEIEVVTKLSN